MERIQINDGCKEYEIVNQNGKVLGIFRFNPADTNIIEKYNAVIEELQKAVFSKDEGNGEEVLLAASGLIKKKMDELFGEDTSRTFFSITGPLTPLADGKLFAESILEGIGAAVEKETKARLKKVRARMDMYTGKYNK